MRNFGRKREPVEPGPGTAAIPDTFGGGLPSTPRPEHPSVNPEDRPEPCARARPAQQHSVHSSSSHTRARDA
eukprot:824086-Prymnesium_polylepis.1